MCCEDGLTPICIVQDGQAQGACRNLSARVSESPDLLSRAIVDVIAELAGEEYRVDASQNIFFFDGVISYESTDGRVQVRATRVLAERDNPGQLAPMR